MTNKIVVTPTKAINMYSMLLSEEERILLKTRHIREDMIDGIIEYNDGKAPTKTSDVRVMNEVLNSLDDQVLGLTDRRFRFEDQKNDADIAGILKDVFANINDYKPNVSRNIEVADKYIPTDIVIDEASIEVKELTFEDVGLGE